MKFVDRDREIERLKRVLQDEARSHFIVVYGRRRLGKSTLIRHVLTDNDIYFMSDLTEQSHQISMLSKAVAMLFPDFDKVVYPDWDTLFNALTHRATRRFTLCFDEFPYMVKTSPSLPSVLQRLIDTKNLPFNLIVCGSSQQMMQGLVLDGAAPLYGRSDVIMKLEPIPIRFLQEILKTNAVQTVEESAVWGGVPRYWEIREHEDSLFSAMEYNMLDVNGTLYDEPSKLFLDNLQQTAQSSTILSLIGNGVNRLSEIAARLQKKATDISGLLTKLINLGYIEREIPFGESPRNTKHSLYRISDPFMCAYYYFVVPNRSLIGLNRQKLVSEIVRSSFSGFVALHWERLCRKAVSGNHLLGTTWGIASRWWGTISDGHDKKMIELDVVAESFDKKKILIGECKWTESEQAARLFHEMEIKAKNLPFAKDHELVFVLFLKNPARDEISENVFLPQDVINDFK